MQARYLESLDTPHFKRRPAPRVAAELQMQLLLGRQVSLSQTQAIDSGHLFHFLKHASKEDRNALLDFFADDRIRVHLRSGLPGLRALVVQSLEREDFHFSAWREFNGERRPMFLAACKEALEAGDQADLKTEFDHVNEQWSFLAQIDERLRDNPAKAAAPVARTAANGLRAGLRTHADAMVAQSKLKTKLQHMLVLHEGKPDSRTYYFRSIEESGDLSHEEKSDLHSIVDGIYNRVVADSIRASGNLEARSQAVADAIATKASVFGSVEEKPGGAPDAGKLQGIGWDTVFEFYRVLEGGFGSEKQRRSKIDGLVDKASGQIEVSLVKNMLAVNLSPRVPEFLDEAFAVGVDKMVEGGGEVAKQGVKHAAGPALAMVSCYFLGHTPLVAVPAVIFVSTVLGKMMGKKLTPTLEGSLKFLAAHKIAASRRELIAVVQGNPSYPKERG